MSWLAKEKISQQGDDEEIQTPDGLQIMVGANEDMLLLYQLAFSNWGNKNKASGEWDLKEKIIS